MARQIQWVGENLDPPAIISIDAGNSNLKGYAYIIEDGQLQTIHFSIPHGYIRLSTTKWEERKRGMKLSRGRVKDTHTFAIVTGGNARNPELLPVTIGKQPSESGDNSPLLGSNKYINGGLDALIVAILQQIFPVDKYPKGHNNLIIGYGFPPTEWQHIDDIEALVNKTHRVVMPDGSKLSYRVRVSVAWDENVGGLVNAMSRNGRDDKGQFTGINFQVNDRVLVIDAGGWLGTMAWARINEHGFAEMDYGDSMTAINGGVIRVRQALRNALRLKFPQVKGMLDRDMTDDWMDDILRTKKFTLSGNRKEVFDASEAIQQAIEDYMANVLEPYTNIFASGRLANHILLTGGTVSSLHEYMVHALNHGSVKLAGERDKIYMANARGGMNILLERLITDGLVPDPFMELMEQS